MPALDENELAQSYGFAMAVLNADPEIKGLFNRAVAETWTPERFQAQLRATGWYQRNGEQARNAMLLKASDPATYAQKIDQIRTRISMTASELGAVGVDLNGFAEQAYTLGWDENQIRRSLSTYIQYTDGRLIGQAGQWEQELRGWAADNGLTLSDAWFQGKVKAAADGTSTVEDGKRELSKMAASAFPHLADRLANGSTLAEIADPYRQTMASLFELNPEQIDLKDPTIREALASKGKDGAPAMSTLFDFENKLRSDTRWLKTKNAQDAATSVTSRVLKDLGVMS